MKSVFKVLSCFLALSLVSVAAFANGGDEHAPKPKAKKAEKTVGQIDPDCPTDSPVVDKPLNTTPGSTPSGTPDPKALPGG